MLHYTRQRLYRFTEIAVVQLEDLLDESLLHTSLTCELPILPPIKERRKRKTQEVDEEVAKVISCEVGKLEVETRKLEMEIYKLQAETKKLDTEDRKLKLECTLLELKIKHWEQKAANEM